MSKGVKIIIVLVSFIAIGGLVGMGFLWTRLNQLETKDISALEEEERENLIKEIGKFLTLPQDEEPQIVTLTEVELNSLKGQVFFANALVGDKLLLYANNSKAVIWRPTAKKIIEASIINLEAPEVPQEPPSLNSN